MTQFATTLPAYPALSAPSRSWLVGLLAAILMVLAPFSAWAQDEEKVAADDPEGAMAFIQKLSDDMLEAWTNVELTETQRQEEFRQLLYTGFDVDYVSKLVLGRHRRTASRSQLNEYLDLFPKYIINIFANRIGDYGDEKFEVLGTAPAGKRDIFVRSQILRPNGNNIAADWRVRWEDGGYSIIDLKVEGISMALTQREEFSAKVEADGMEGLLEQLRSGTGTLDFGRKAAN